MNKNKLFLIFLGFFFAGLMILLLNSGCGVQNSSNPGPANLTATGGYKQVVLTWEAKSGAASYRIYWNASDTAVSKNNGTRISNLTGTTYTHSGLYNGLTYYYVVTAIDSGGGETEDSTYVSATPTFSVTPETVDASGVFGGNCSLALDSNKKAHISYYDMQNKHLKYATNANGSWVTSTLDSSLNTGAYSSIAVDSNNKVHIVYSSGSSLMYVTNSSGSWATAIPISTTWDGLYVGLALDSNNKAHVAFCDSTGLKYATNSSGSWETTTVDSYYKGRYPSLVVEGTGKAHIAYKSLSDGYLRYATNASGSWVKTLIDSNGEAGVGINIDRDSSGGIHVFYTLWDNGNNLTRYATNTTGSWVIDRPTDVALPGNYYTTVIANSFMLDSDGKAHVGLSNGGVYYINNLSGYWVKGKLVTNTTGLSYEWTSLVVDSNDKIHVAYFDTDNSRLMYLSGD